MRRDPKHSLDWHQPTLQSSAYPGRYPAPASSQLYHKIEGTFKRDVINSEVLKNIGLVSGSVFCDIDSDGDSDLILATEWGPIQIFQNEAGKFIDATDLFGLDSYKGWWNGVNVIVYDPKNVCIHVCFLSPD